MEKHLAPVESFSKKVSRRSAILFLPALAGVIGGELGPSRGAPQIWDKALHFTAYFILSALAVMGFGASKRALWAMFGLIVMGAALEIIQGMIGRDMSAFDELANSLGVIAGGIVAWAIFAMLVRLRSAD
ncbi:MAG TPA: VanZ family protein [Rhizomicrobium sp.]|jgi:VanZ family protein